MRFYGSIQSASWEEWKRLGLSTEAKLLACYLLSSPHSNSVGCYRLPAAYLADDLGWVSDTVSDTLSILYRIRFLRRDDHTGWTWIVRYLDSNPIQNPKMGKAAQAFIEAVPPEVEFYQDFVASLKAWAHRFDEGFLDQLDTKAKRYRNGMAYPNHTYTNPDPDPVPDPVPDPETSPSADAAGDHEDEQQDLGFAGQREAAKPRRKATTRRHRIPDNWQPNEKHRARAAALNLDVERMAEKFRHHYRASGALKVDWDEQFFVWMGNEDEKRTGAGNGADAAAGGLHPSAAASRRRPTGVAGALATAHAQLHDGEE